MMLSFVTPIFGLCRKASNNGNTGLFIGVGTGVDAELIVKGEVTFNSNGFYGMYSSLNPNANLEINVENGSTSTLETCGNSPFDIGGSVSTPATVDFSGTGYTCNQAKVSFDGPGGSTVVKPVCQSCT